MTKTAAPALVISTKAERSGEISRPYGTVGMEQETLPPLPPLEMTMAAGRIPSFQRRTNDKTLSHPSSFRPQRSGVEKSHSPMVCSIVAGDLSTLSFYSPRGFMSHTGMFLRSR